MESSRTPGPFDVPDLQPPAGEPPWEALALLAVVMAMSEALSRTKRRRLVARLELIAADWERHAADLPAGAIAAARFLRPTLELLRASRSDAGPLTRPPPA